MVTKVNTIGLFGLNAFPVTAEINAYKGVPDFQIVGLADVSVQESKQRIFSAMANTGIALENKTIVINLTPASVKKTGASYDLAIFAAMIAAQGEESNIKADLEKSAFFGEISLCGDVMPVNGALSMAIEARNNGITHLFVPHDNAAEASVVKGLKVHEVRHIGNLYRYLLGHGDLAVHKPYTPEAAAYVGLDDFADVKGQENIKIAMTIAAAGFHNLLMVGTPGTGKSMLAKRLPSILPQMSFDESIETTQVYSVAGMVDKNAPLIVNRPFRAVSHTASAAGLVGGSGTPRPGEISLAHNGVLFLDELPEFDRRVLETLRQPVENREIIISRALGSVRYPCNFMLVAAMNPCPCGNFGHPTKSCICSPAAVTRYLGKVSQPVLDRIDIQVEVNPLTYDEISAKNQDKPENRICSAQMREDVERVREIQKRRFVAMGVEEVCTSNSEIPAKLLDEVCVLAPAAKELIKGLFDKLGMSARAYDRILKVARTAADVDGCELIERKHLSQAISYRSLDRKYWNR